MPRDLFGNPLIYEVYSFVDVGKASASAGRGRGCVVGKGGFEQVTETVLLEVTVA